MVFFVHVSERHGIGQELVQVVDAFLANILVECQRSWNYVAVGLDRVGRFVKDRNGGAKVIRLFGFCINSHVWFSPRSDGLKSSERNNVPTQRAAALEPPSKCSATFRSGIDELSACYRQRRVDEVLLGSVLPRKVRVPMIECLRPIARYPFTLSMALLLVVAGIYGRTLVGPLDSLIQHHSGHSAHLLWRGDFHRLLTSLFFTAGGWRFYSSLAMLIVAVGCCERQVGTVTVAMGFFGIHLATLLLMSTGIALITSIVETHRGAVLWYVKDVGPSAGYYGCLGLALASLVSNVRFVLVLVVFLILAVRLSWTSYYLPEEGQMMSADLSHMIAFPLGLLLSRFVGGSQQGSRTK